MDSGQGRALNAREMAEEINRVTDEALVAEVEREASAQRGFTGDMQPMGNAGVSEVQAQALGRGAIFGGAEAGVTISEMGNGGGYSEISGSDDRSLDREALVLSEAENRLEHSEAFLGMASKVQQEEYKKEDAAELGYEQGIGNPLEVRGTKKGLEGVAEAVAPVVDQMMHQSVINLNQFEMNFHDWNEEALEKVGRGIGWRNK